MLKKVAVVLHRQVALFEFGVVNEVFGLDRTDDGVPAFEFLIASPDPGVPLSIGHGAAVVPPHALDDCLDAYRWLRETGYEPDQIVLAGDSAGGYLSLALAERLLVEGLDGYEGETPAAVVTMSPLFEIDNEGRADHPNVRSDAMFPHKAFHALVELIEEAASKRVVDGEPEQIYEPLDHIEPGLPRTLIHVSGSEVLLSDARKAARLLAAAGVPVEIRIWPGQMHVFQLGAPAVSEATRSIRQIGEYIREATW